MDFKFFLDKSQGSNSYFSIAKSDFSVRHVAGRVEGRWKRRGGRNGLALANLNSRAMPPTRTRWKDFGNLMAVLDSTSSRLIAARFVACFQLSLSPVSCLLSAARLVRPPLVWCPLWPARLSTFVDVSFACPRAVPLVPFRSFAGSPFCGRQIRGSVAGSLFEACILTVVRRQAVPRRRQKRSDPCVYAVFPSLPSSALGR